MRQEQDLQIVRQRVTHENLASQQFSDLLLAVAERHRIAFEVFGPYTRVLRPEVRHSFIDLDVPVVQHLALLVDDRTPR